MCWPGKYGSHLWYSLQVLGESLHCAIAQLLPAQEGKYLLPTPLKAALKMNTLPSNRVGIRTPESEACWKVDESVWSDVCTISFRAHFNV